MASKKKANTAPATADEQTLHPYFDDIDQDVWLTATVVEEIPCAMQFAVTPPAHWTPELVRRVEGHFLAFGLGDLYALEASDELVGYNGYFTDLANQGSDVLRAHLADVADSQVAARRNHWQTATYRALSSNTWFCSGGFLPARAPSCP
ncbi:hypothetical protein AB0M32_09550 [Streptomyces sp. NPDC051985]|uniref:hypothetical protein n=1 Tax=Streptomyces sp. NPDC051985 TaxID=3155807 RepID=UPI00341875F8